MLDLLMRIYRAPTAIRPWTDDKDDAGGAYEMQGMYALSGPAFLDRSTEIDNSNQPTSSYHVVDLPGVDYHDAGAVAGPVYPHAVAPPHPAADPLPHPLFAFHAAIEGEGPLPQPAAHPLAIQGNLFADQPAPAFFQPFLQGPMRDCAICDAPLLNLDALAVEAHLRACFPHEDPVMSECPVCDVAFHLALDKGVREAHVDLCVRGVVQVKNKRFRTFLSLLFALLVLLSIVEMIDVDMKADLFRSCHAAFVFPISGRPKDDACSICLEEYQPGEELSMLPCLCLYHPGCIEDEWCRPGGQACATHRV